VCIAYEWALLSWRSPGALPSGHGRDSMADISAGDAQGTGRRPDSGSGVMRP